MLAHRYTITQAIQDVAEMLAYGNDHSATTIRCTLNDALDAASKSGHHVNHDYNQPHAVARVKSLIAKIRSY